MARGGVVAPPPGMRPGGAEGAPVRKAPEVTRQPQPPRQEAVLPPERAATPGQVAHVEQRFNRATDAAQVRQITQDMARGVEPPPREPTGGTQVPETASPVQGQNGVREPQPNSTGNGSVSPDARGTNQPAAHEEIPPEALAAVRQILDALPPDQRDAVARQLLGPAAMAPNPNRTPSVPANPNTAANTAPNTPQNPNTTPNNPPNPNVAANTAPNPNTLNNPNTAANTAPNAPANPNTTPNTVPNPNTSANTPPNPNTSPNAQPNPNVAANTSPDTRGRVRKAFDKVARRTHYEKGPVAPPTADQIKNPHIPDKPGIKSSDPDFAGLTPEQQQTVLTMEKFAANPVMQKVFPHLIRQFNNPNYLKQLNVADIRSLDALQTGAMGSLTFKDGKVYAKDEHGKDKEFSKLSHTERARIRTNLKENAYTASADETKANEMADQLVNGGAAEEGKYITYFGVQTGRAVANKVREMHGTTDPAKRAELHQQLQPYLGKFLSKEDQETAARLMRDPGLHNENDKKSLLRFLLEMGLIVGLVVGEEMLDATGIKAMSQGKFQ